MNIKADGAQTGGAFTLIEWSAPAGVGQPCGDKHFTAGPGDFTRSVKESCASSVCGSRRSASVPVGLARSSKTC
jgi:hypothetical protein